MRKPSLIHQIIMINIMVMSIFFMIFSLNNYRVTTSQLSKIIDKNVNSNLEMIVPIIAINMSLGLEQNYKNIMDNTFEVHSELVSMVLVNDNNETVYEISREGYEISRKDLNMAIVDSILGTQIGTLKVQYGLSHHYQELLQEYFSFNVGMFMVFILSLMMLTLLLKKNLYPLKKLLNNINSYKLKEENAFIQSISNDEVAIINNTIVEMLDKIEKEVDLKLYYEQEIMKKEKLVSMGEMLDNIAHQWRQPLMKINAVLLNMDCRIQENEIDKYYFMHKIDEISETVNYLSETIDTFREYVNPNKVKTRFGVVEMLNRSLFVFKSSLDEIEVRISNGRKYDIEGVENEFMQVIIAILNNAAEVLTSRAISQPKIWIKVNHNDHQVVITIEDNGGGIKENIIKKIFDPYFTTKYKIGGTGLGLYMARLIIVNSFHGDIHVTNSSRGAKFTLYFPRER